MRCPANTKNLDDSAHKISHDSTSSKPFIFLKAFGNFEIKTIRN